MTICLRVLVWKIENLVDTWIEQAGVVMSYRSWSARQCVPVLILELSQSESCFWRTSNFGLLMMLIHPHMKASGSSERRKLWTQHGRSFKCNVSDSGGFDMRSAIWLWLKKLLAPKQWMNLTRNIAKYDRFCGFIGTPSTKQLWVAVTRKLRSFLTRNSASWHDGADLVGMETYEIPSGNLT